MNMKQKCWVLALGVIMVIGVKKTYAVESHIEQTLRTSAAFVEVKGSNGNTVSVSVNTGGNVQERTSTSEDSLPERDNLREFVNKQQIDIENFKKEKRAELQVKTAKIREQRKVCGDKVKTLTKDRAQQKQELYRSCKPSIAQGEPSSSDEAKMRAIQYKEILTSCRQKVSEFEKETKKELTELKTQCNNAERSILGLSTTIPATVR